VVKSLFRGRKGTANGNRFPRAGILPGVAILLFAESG